MLKNTQGGFLISQIKQISGRIFEKILIQNKIDDFNGPQGRILYILWQEDSIPIKELSKKTGLALTTLTSMLDRMESTDLVNRTFSKTDRRKVLIVLTENAKKLKNKYDDVSSQMNEVYYEGFSDNEIIQFENYLSRILKNIKQKEDE